MKIWRLKVELEDNQGFQLVNKDKFFLEEFEKNARGEIFTRDR